MKRRFFLQAGGAALLWRASKAWAGKASGARVVVMGGGFAGSACALKLRHLNPTLRVTLIDPDDIYTSCPMSNSVIVGQRAMRSLQVSRAGSMRAGVRYVRDEVVSIDTQARRVRLAGGVALDYDRLVVAGGIRMLWGRPEGLSEAASLRMPHAWKAGAQTELLAAQVRALPDGGVMAISVPAGPMRCPPGPFERASLIAEYLKRAKQRCKILIFDSNNHFPRQEQFSAAWKSLYPGMIEWISVVDGGAIDRVDPARMLLVCGGVEHRVDVANVIPPQAPASVAAQAGLASDHGWCPVKPLTFESSLAQNVYVIGDSCIADPMPKSASAACSQAVQCAASIVASLSGHEPTEALLDSVCYSELGVASALSIHGRFHATANGIEQLPAAVQEAGSPSDEAVQAQQWFSRTLQLAFGAEEGT